MISSVATSINNNATQNYLLKTYLNEAISTTTSKNSISTPFKQVFGASKMNMSGVSNAIAYITNNQTTDNMYTLGIVANPLIMSNGNDGHNNGLLGQPGFSAVPNDVMQYSRGNNNDIYYQIKSHLEWDGFTASTRFKTNPNDTGTRTKYRWFTGINWDGNVYVGNKVMSVWNSLNNCITLSKLPTNA
jgi:hypothetical protein